MSKHTRFSDERKSDPQAELAELASQSRLDGTALGVRPFADPETKPAVGSHRTLAEGFAAAADERDYRLAMHARFARRARGEHDA